jgi:hypothetical protein
MEAVCAIHPNKKLTWKLHFCNLTPSGDAFNDHGYYDYAIVGASLLACLEWQALSG